MEYMAGQPDNAFDLIIVDPPYFEVKGDFDFKWESFSEYLGDVERWAIELSRVLKDNGSLLWWEHAKKIAYSQVIIDKHLNLENSLIWWKHDAQTNKGVEEFRSFAPVTERLLFYSKEIEMTGLKMIDNDLTLYKNIRDYFKEERGKTELSFKEINEKCFGTASNGGGMASNILTAHKLNWTFPTKEKYEALQRIGICQRSYESLRQEYESLRQEYEILRRPFTNDLKLTDVMKFSQEGHVTGKYNHPTQKPPKLTRALVRTIGRKGGRAFIPFMGSGTETIECFNFGMDVMATEIDTDHFKEAEERVENETRQVAMF